MYPHAFFDHTYSLISFTDAVTCLTVAYQLTREDKYLSKVVNLLETWFLKEDTYMSPHLEYSSAIPGTCTGRCYGIIHTHDLVEVALAIRKIEDRLPQELCEGLRNWFGRFNDWLLHSKHGLEEKKQSNNHSIYWLIQVTAYCVFTENSRELENCRNYYKEVILPGQVERDGSMPWEIRRTKSFVYSVFALNGLAILCKLLSTKEENMFEYTTTDGRGVLKGMEFMFPYLNGSSRWPHQDISGLDSKALKPIAPLFIGKALNIEKYTNYWKSLAMIHSDKFEIRRDQCVKQPYLWENAKMPWMI